MLKKDMGKRETVLGKMSIKIRFSVLSHPY
jgi:hypothetical protein